MGAVFNFCLLFSPSMRIHGVTFEKSQVQRISYLEGQKRVCIISEDWGEGVMQVK